ncbi:hypothetical protein AMELA_G00162490 [Ameiurus melas]|uniref:CD59 glycoprotein-like n=1 Tax=Ameiurus melas TaxID=219545 RepID=A0A7J6AF88_AMEME|nr:hypothetical protein AMELA_G00162490 [Ameiurus melas]
MRGSRGETGREQRRDGMRNLCPEWAVCAVDFSLPLPQNISRHCKLCVKVEMKYSFGLFVLISSLTVSVCNKHYGMHYSSYSTSLRCYKCSDYYGGWCTNVQDCTYEDSCLSLHEKGGKTIRQCIRYTDCDNSRLKQMFPAVSGFTYRCCNSNLCNSGQRDTAILSLFISLLSVWWSCC